MSRVDAHRCRPGDVHRPVVEVTPMSSIGALLAGQRSWHDPSRKDLSPRRACEGDWRRQCQCEDWRGNATVLTSYAGAKLNKAECDVMPGLPGFTSRFTFSKIMPRGTHGSGHHGSQEGDPVVFGWRRANELAWVRSNRWPQRFGLWDSLAELCWWFPNHGAGSAVKCAGDRGSSMWGPAHGPTNNQVGW